MSITINLASYLQPYTYNVESVIVKGKTVRECLADLVRQYPDIDKMLFMPDGKLHTYVSVFVGAEMTPAEELDKSVKDGDTLHILYIIGGG
jgi:molybdopterin converting factor small subunit